MTSWIKRHKRFAILFAGLLVCGTAAAAGWFYFSTNNPGTITTHSGLHATVDGGISAANLFPSPTDPGMDPSLWTADQRVAGAASTLVVTVPVTQDATGVRLTFSASSPSAAAMSDIHIAIWLHPSWAGTDGVGAVDTLLTPTALTLEQLNGLVIDVPAVLPSTVIGDGVMTIGFVMNMTPTAPESAQAATITTNVKTEIGPFGSGPSSWTW